MKATRFRQQDIPIAITTLIQVLVENAAPDAERVVQHLHDELNWDKYYESAADLLRYRRERD